MSLLAERVTRGAAAVLAGAERELVAGPIENEDTDPVGDGHADADMAGPQPPEPVLPNPQPDVPPSPLDDEPGERPDEPGDQRAREPGRAARSGALR